MCGVSLRVVRASAFLLATDDPVRLLIYGLSRTDGHDLNQLFRGDCIDDTDASHPKTAQTSQLLR